jgi:glutamyl-tRNA reductase
MLCRTDGIYWIDYHRRYESIGDVSVVVSATTSPHYTVTGERFRECVRDKMLIIDLAVPCDIDKDIADIPGVRLLDIDYFNTLSRENVNIRIGEMDKVRSIVNECIEELFKKLYIRQLRESFEEKNGDNEILKMVYYLRDILESAQLYEIIEKIYEKEFGE